MSGVKFAAQTVEVTTGTTKKTLLQILAATNHRLLVKEISISFDGVSNTAAPIFVEVLRQSDAGSGGDVIVPEKLDESDDETLQVTALENIDGSTQPTDVGRAVMSENVHPQGGYTWQAPFGGEIEVKGGNRLGIAVLAGAAINATVRINGEE